MTRFVKMDLMVHQQTALLRMLFLHGSVFSTSEHVTIFLSTDDRLVTQNVFIVVFNALGNLLLLMKTINMNTKQNIFLMKHFTQCTKSFLSSVAFCCTLLYISK